MNESGMVSQSNLTRSYILDKDGKTVIRFRSKSKEKKTVRIKNLCVEKSFRG